MKSKKQDLLIEKGIGNFLFHGRYEKNLTPLLLTIPAAPGPGY